MTTWAFEMWVLESERKKSEIWHETFPLPALKMEKPQWQGVWAASGSWEWPQLTASKETGSSVSSTFSRNWILPTVWMRFFPWGSGWEKQSSQHLGFSIVRSWAENQVMPCLDFCFTDCELITGYCCKLLNLWWYVMKRQKTHTQSIHFLTYKMKISTLSTS